jgi:hypothetical protein
MKALLSLLIKSLFVLLLWTSENKLGEVPLGEGIKAACY